MLSGSVHEHKIGIPDKTYGSLLHFQSMCNCNSRIQTLAGKSHRKQPLFFFMIAHFLNLELSLHIFLGTIKHSQQKIIGNPQGGHHEAIFPDRIHKRSSSLMVRHLLQNPCLPCSPWLTGSHLHLYLQAAELGDHLVLCSGHGILLREATVPGRRELDPRGPEGGARRGAEGLRPHWPRRHPPRRHRRLVRHRCLHAPRAAAQADGSTEERRLVLVRLRHLRWLCPTALARESPSPKRQECEFYRPSGVMQVGPLIWSWAQNLPTLLIGPVVKLKHKAWLLYTYIYTVTTSNCAPLFDVDLASKQLASCLQGCGNPPPSCNPKQAFSTVMCRNVCITVPQRFRVITFCGKVDLKAFRTCIMKHSQTYPNSSWTMMPGSGSKVWLPVRSVRLVTRPIPNMQETGRVGLVCTSLVLFEPTLVIFGQLLVARAQNDTTCWASWRMIFLMWRFFFCYFRGPRMISRLWGNAPPDERIEKDRKGSKRIEKDRKVGHLEKIEGKHHLYHPGTTVRHD